MAPGLTTSHGLTARALRGVTWNYVGTAGRILATFASQILLARLLGPEQVGLFGYALLTMAFLALFVEMGLPTAIVQVAVLDDDVYAVACGRLLFVGAVAALGIFLSADLVARYVFSVPQAAPVLMAMAPTLIVGAANASAIAVLSREIEFKVIQMASLGSYVVGYLVVGVSAAAHGLGVWSLVLAWHVQTITAYLAIQYFGQRLVVPRNPFRRLGIAKFGAVVMATNIVNWCIDSGPHMIIGRFLGPTLLGQYTIANNLVKVPADYLIRSLQTVLFPLSARSQDINGGLRRAYLTLLSGVGLVSFPAFTYVALMSQEIVGLLLGSKWLAASQVLTPLAMAVLGHVMEALCGPILSGRGEPKAELRVKIITLPLMLTVLVFTASLSLAAVGWGVALVYLFRWGWMHMAVAKRLKVSVWDLGKTLLGPFVLAVICWAMVASAAFAFGADGRSMQPYWLLSITAASCILASVVALLAMPQIVLGAWLLALMDRLIRERPAIARKPGLRRLAALASRSSA
jgi:lipopolysaccharide exporter